MENLIEKNTFIEKINEQLDHEQYIVFSTESRNGVRSRTVDYINLDLTIGFFSWDYTGKIADIHDDARVSMCIQNINIEGEAGIYKKDEEKIAKYIGKYSEKLPVIYNIFDKLDNTVFIIVKPLIIRKMLLENNELVHYTYDFALQTIKREKLSDWL
jgi:hypothetical protein